jgi:hypothetical protein
MNIIIALEQLGYVNFDDFTVDWDEDLNAPIITEWKHTDSVPTEAALQVAWDEWDATHGLTLEDFKSAAKLNIDNMAEAVRLQYVTPGSSQSMVYQEKGDEAADYVAAGYPVDLSSYPFIQAEVNATGKTSADAADDILAQKSAWIVVGAAVEEVRIGGKINIDAAADEAEVDSIRDAALAALAVI